MIKWYLVLWLFNGGMVNIPEPYNSETECHNAGSGFEGIKHICVKAPARSTCTCTGTLGVYPCECSVPTSKGYVCQPGATTCEVVK